LEKVEARGEFLLSCQEDNGAETIEIQDIELASLPMCLADSRDVLTTMVFVGKTVLKAVYGSL